MGSIYIYDANAEDFTGIGLVGALVPLSCTFTEIANGKSSIELEHPMDELGRYRAIQEMRILKADVPVRTAPEIRNGQFVTQVERYRFKNTATKADRTIYNKADPSARHQKKLKVANAGDEVIVVGKPETESHRWKVKYTYTERRHKKDVQKTVTGYIGHATAAIEELVTVQVENDSAGIEAVAPSWNVEEQLFRIIRVEKGEDTVRAEAMHISYDLMYNLTAFDTDETRTLQAAADEMLGACFDAHSFTFQTNLLGEKAGFHFRDKDPITALLDPESGLIPRWDGELIRDNYGLTALASAGVNRGALLTYGKNVQGVHIETDYSNVATAIRPCGETEDGDPLYLEHSYLWNPATGERTEVSDENGIVYHGGYHRLEGGTLVCDLPTARISPLKGEECKVNKKEKIDAANVRERLLDQAVEALEGGAGLPDVSATVDLALLGETPEYSLYRALERVFLFDTVRVFHPKMGIDLSAEVTQIEWDCIEDAPISLQLGTGNDLTASIAGWQIGSVNGGKIAGGTITGAQLQKETITTEHIQADTINASRINTESLTAAVVAAVHGRFQEIDADEAHISELYADVATIVSAVISDAKIQNLVAEQASIERLKAAIADIASANITTASIIEAQIHWASIDELAARLASIQNLNVDDFKANNATIGDLLATNAQLAQADVDIARIKDLSADTEFVTTILSEDGNARKYRISELEVTESNMVSLTTGELILKNQNGDFVRLTVDEDGNVTGETVTVSGDNIANGTIAGRNLIENTITARELNVDSIFAEKGSIIELITKNLDADVLFANEAFIGRLNTTDITANEHLRIGLQQAAETAETYVKQLVIGSRNYIRNSRSLTNAAVIAAEEYSFAGTAKVGTAKAM